MFEIEEVKGIINHNRAIPLEKLDKEILLRPEEYIDSIKKFGKLYLANHRGFNTSIIDINEKLEEYPNFWPFLDPVINQMEIQSNIFPGFPNNKQNFISLVSQVSKQGLYLFNLEKLNYHKLDPEQVVMGVKITDANGVSVYSFDPKDRELINIRRVK